MSTNGILDFQNTNKVIFRGTDSNVVVDTSNASIGIGIQGTEKPGSNLHVIGDASISSNLKLTTDTSITVNSNVVTDFNGPHAREPKEVPLKKYPEIIFEEGKMDENRIIDTYTQAGYTVSASSFHTNATRDYHTWKVFDGSIANNAHAWLSGYVFSNTGDYNASTSDELTGIVASSSGGVTSRYGAWLQLKLPCKIKLSEAHLYGRYYAETQRIDAGYIYGSNNGTSWTQIGEISASGISSGNLSTYTDVQPLIIKSTDTTNSYKYFIVQATSLTHSSRYAGIGQLEYYGYEEDPPAGDSSIDTTFKSILNTPQTTGANVYVDAKLSSAFTNQVTGPTPVGTTATHDNTNKYWEMNGQLTSNITVEANTFLEGDQPHAVSMWFNSSNLEANVSNTCVFSIASEEKLDSQNLDLQSNTWHNLTYSYQGEGGSRVTYLDGRKVSEDLAEDTFGEYPPFDMTGYSQGGYVVSMSDDYTSDSNNLRQAYELYYDGSSASSPENEGWMTDFGTFNPNAVGGDTFIDSDGGTHTGHFNKLKLPYKLKPSYFYYKHYGVFNSSRNASNWVILGSNNDSDWDLLHSSTTVLNATKRIPITATKGYTYLMFLCKSVNADTALFMGEIRYYGHRENDIVRLPDPTRVLKYPHIAMTTETTLPQGPQINPGMPGDRGYEIIYSNHGGTPQLPSRVFDGVTNSTTNPNDCWMTGGGTYNTGDGALASGQTHALTIDGTSRGGSWVGMKMPRKLKLSSVVYYPRHGFGWEIYNGYVVGSNNGTSWDSLLTISAQTGWAANTPKTFTMTNNLNTYYQYFAILATHVQANNTAGRFAIQELEFYGTEEATPVPIQIGGGNIDKVANFRVYDKFVGEDQALEIWDAQKDEFGRAKSSATLHKGRLGFGTEEPEGRLAVLDEPHNLEEFPPGSMRSYKDYFEGHGVFCASSSSEYLNSAPPPTYTYVAYQGFARIHKNADNAYRDITWNSVSPSYSSSTGLVSSDASLGGYAGEWLKLSLPYGVKISGYQLAIRSAWFYYGPDNWVILGSNDDKNWDLVSSVTTGRIAQGTNGEQMMTKDFSVETTKYYKYLALVCSKIVGSPANQVNFTDLRYFGTREQGQSVLRDGQLTLTKNLDVPRIGPSLDTDDTPRRDRLIAEFNTSTDPTFEGAVKDTSGRGNDGMLIGGASYDVTEKAIVFDGTGDYIKMCKWNYETGFVHSFSGWVKFKKPEESWTVIYGVGNEAGADRTNFNIWALTNSNKFRTEADGTGGYIDHTFEFTGKMDQWMHVAVVKSRASIISTRMYINGEILPQGSGSNQNEDIVMPNSPQSFNVGATSQSNGSEINADYSNIKFYNVALTAEEVKTLYDMGRNGSVVKPQPLHIAAPLYAPGTIVQVESTTMLDTWSSSLAADAATAATTFIDVEGMSVKIRPKFSNSKILISYHANMGSNNGHFNLRLRRTLGNGVETYLAEAAADGNRMQGTSYLHGRASSAHCLSFEHLDNPGSDTGDITYQLVAYSKRGDAYYIHLNRSGNDSNSEYYGRSSSTITVKEICQ